MAEKHNLEKNANGLSPSGRVAKPEHSCKIIKTFAEYKTEEKRGGPHRSFKNG